MRIASIVVQVATPKGGKGQWHGRRGQNDTPAQGSKGLKVLNHVLKESACFLHPPCVQFSSLFISKIAQFSMAASPEEGLLKVSNSNSKAYQPFERLRPTSIYAKYVTNGWLVELLSVLLGIVALIALCVLLKRYDGKAAPRVNAVAGVNITLNTLVSILSTISRAALLLSVSECISQSKWSWFLDRQKPLEDLDVFDEASRGAWGGLKLLWRVNVRFVPPLRFFAKQSALTKGEAKSHLWVHC